MSHMYEINEVLERDVYYFSRKFGLSRVNLRIIMHSPMVANIIHGLDYDVTARELYDALLPAYEFSKSEQNKVSDQNQIRKRCINACMNHLKRIIESES